MEMTSENKHRKHLPFVLNYLPDFCIQVAKDELNETNEVKEISLQNFQIKIKESDTLHDIDFEPDFLIQYLRVSKYNVEAAFNRLQKYIKFRRSHPGYFSGVGDKISCNSAYRWFSPVPYRSKDGSSIVVQNYGMWDPRDISFEHLNQIAHLIAYESLRNPINQIVSCRMIMDFKGISIRHSAYTTPRYVHQMAQMYTQMIPLRFKCFHFVNCSRIMQMGYAVCAPFIPEKLRKRIIFHKKVEELLEYMDEEVLPVVYGGKVQSYYMYDWMKEANISMSKSTLKGSKNLF